jgi:hypothetical protein
LFLEKVLESARLLAGSTRDLASLRLYAFRRDQDHRRFLRLDPPSKIADPPSHGERRSSSG